MSNIPADLRVPFTYVELDTSQASAVVDGVRPTVLLGHMWTSTHSEVLAERATAGSASLNTFYAVADAEQAAAFFGAGSVLHQMIIAFRRANATGELYCMAVAEDGSATQATWTVTFTGAATAAGVVYLYVRGVVVQVAVASGDDNDAVAAKVVTAVNADSLAYGLGVWAAATDNVVTISAQVKGVIGASLDVRLNYKGLAAGEALPAGIGATVAAATAGSTWPTMTTPVAALGDEPFDFIAVPWSNGTVLSAVLAEVVDRWDYDRRLDGHVIGANLISAYDAANGFATAGSAAAQLLAFAAARNSGHESLPYCYDLPTSGWEFVATLAGVASAYLGEDPAAGLQTLVLPGILPPVRNSGARFSFAARDSFLHNGVGTWVVDQASSAVVLERVVTTYTRTPSGVRSVDWMDITTPVTASRFHRALVAHIQSRYARAKIIDDDAKIRPSSGVVAVKPKEIAGEVVVKYEELMRRGWVEDLDGFKAALGASRSTTDRNRVNLTISPNYVNPLMVIAITSKPRL